MIRSKDYIIKEKIIVKDLCNIRSFIYLLFFQIVVILSPSVVFQNIFLLVRTALYRILSTAVLVFYIDIFVTSCFNIL
jgi:hypothetical protein